MTPSFNFGRVGQHDLAAIRASKPFQRVANAVMHGVQECSRTCEYFSVCGGGAPSNKYFENQSLSSTTTMELGIDIGGLNGVLLAMSRRGAPTTCSGQAVREGVLTDRRSW